MPTVNNSNQSNQPKQGDPLYNIFEEHLFNFQDSDTDRKTFIENVVKEYFAFLRKMNILVPKSLESTVFEELCAQVNTMLTKKIYGLSKIQDYNTEVKTMSRRKVRKRESRSARGGARR